MLKTISIGELKRNPSHKSMSSFTAAANRIKSANHGTLTKINEIYHGYWDLNATTNETEKGVTTQ